MPTPWPKSSCWSPTLQAPRRWAKALLITAGVEAPHKALLRFVVKTPDGKSEVLHEYSQVKSLSYTPKTVGTYEIILTAKDSQSSADQDDRETLSVAVQDSPAVDGDSDATGNAQNGGGGCATSPGGLSGLLLLALLGLALRRREHA